MQIRPAEIDSYKDSDLFDVTYFKRKSVFLRVSFFYNSVCFINQANSVKISTIYISAVSVCIIFIERSETSMLDYLVSKIKYRQYRKQSSASGAEGAAAQNSAPYGSYGEIEGLGKISANINQNRTYLKNLFKDTTDVRFREFQFDLRNNLKSQSRNQGGALFEQRANQQKISSEPQKVLLIFVDGLADSDVINNDIIQPLMYGRTLFNGSCEKKTEMDDEAEAGEEAEPERNVKYLQQSRRERRNRRNKGKEKKQGRNFADDPDNQGGDLFIGEKDGAKAEENTEPDEAAHDNANIRILKELLLSVGDIEEAADMNQVVEGCLMGDTVLLLDGCTTGIIISSKGYEIRSINESSTEVVVRGPKESFNENLRSNTAMIRRKIRNPALTFENMRIGQKTKTLVNIVYIKGLANQKLIDEAKRRLQAINTDAILESGYIEQFIEDAPLSIFATLGHTEKPDVLAAKILEGRIGIIVDGTPFVLTAPYLFLEAFQAAEDYYGRSAYSSLIRIFRFISFFISVLAPSLYVALTTFHQELIPTSLLFTMAAAREGVPFTALIETVVFLLIFEILKEAGLRLPKPIGQTISIVGALVMGEAAVSAGLVGAPLVIVVALTAVSGFVVSSANEQEVLLRWIFLILSGLLGGVGITIGIIGLLLHTTALRSFGYAYLSPLLPVDTSDLKDSMVRAPLWLMHRRPSKMAAQDEIRENSKIPPA